MQQVPIPTELKSSPGAVLEEYVQIRMLQFLRVFAPQIKPNVSDFTIESAYFRSLSLLDEPSEQREGDGCRVWEGKVGVPQYTQLDDLSSLDHQSLIGLEASRDPCALPQASGERSQLSTLSSPDATTTPAQRAPTVERSQLPRLSCAEAREESLAPRLHTLTQLHDYETSEIPDCCTLSSQLPFKLSQLPPLEAQTSPSTLALPPSFSLDEITPIQGPHPASKLPQLPSLPSVYASNPRQGSHLSMPPSLPFRPVLQTVPSTFQATHPSVKTASYKRVKLDMPHTGYGSGQHDGGGGGRQDDGGGGGRRNDRGGGGKFNGEATPGGGGGTLLGGGTGQRQVPRNQALSVKIGQLQAKIHELEQKHRQKQQHKQQCQVQQMQNNQLSLSNKVIDSVAPQTRFPDCERACTPPAAPAPLAPHTKVEYEEYEATSPTHAAPMQKRPSEFEAASHPSLARMHMGSTDCGTPSPPIPLMEENSTEYEAASALMELLSCTLTAGSSGSSRHMVKLKKRKM
eukprot:gene7067-165_t